MVLSCLVRNFYQQCGYAMKLKFAFLLNKIQANVDDTIDSLDSEIAAIRNQSKILSRCLLISKTQL